MRTRNFLNYVRDEAATTAIEFALISSAFIALIFGIFESGRMFLVWNSFQAAIGSATRHALVNPDISEDEIEDRIIESMEAYGIDGDDVEIEVTQSASSGVDFIEVDG